MNYNLEKNPRFLVFSERVYVARKGARLTQEKLAEKANLSVSSIRRAESGDTISRATIEKLEDALHIKFNTQACMGIRSCPYAYQCLNEITNYLAKLPDSKEVK